jgi:hypothetical protein
MTREDIIKMAREAGFFTLTAEECVKKTGGVFFGLCDDSVYDELERFAALVAEAEREACKKLSQEHAAEYRVGGRLYAPLGENYALCAATACDHIVHLIEERGSK